jgi:hypothetical protein
MANYSTAYFTKMAKKTLGLVKKNIKFKKRYSNEPKRVELRPPFMNIIMWLRWHGVKTFWYDECSIATRDLQKEKIILPRGFTKSVLTKLSCWTPSIHILAIYSWEGLEAMQIYQGRKKIAVTLNFLEQFRKKYFAYNLNIAKNMFVLV